MKERGTSSTVGEEESCTGYLMQTGQRPPAIDVGGPTRHVHSLSYDDDDEISDSNSDEDDSMEEGVTQFMPRRMSGSRLPSSGPSSPISSMGKVSIDAEMLVQIGTILETFPSPPMRTPGPAEGAAAPPAAKPQKIGAALSSGVSAAMSGFRGLWN